MELFIIISAQLLLSVFFWIGFQKNFIDKGFLNYNKLTVYEIYTDLVDKVNTLALLPLIMISLYTDFFPIYKSASEEVYVRILLLILILLIKNKKIIIIKEK